MYNLKRIEQEIKDLPYKLHYFFIFKQKAILQGIDCFIDYKAYFGD